MASRIRVMIIDDIAETREQLRKLLSFDPDIEVAAMVSSGEEAVQIVGQTFPDVALMDINLPGMDGITATGKLLERVPTVQVIMLSVQGETDYMRRAMMAGARDYLTKPPGADELLDAIHRAYTLRQKMGTGPLTAAGISGVPGVGIGYAAPSLARIITVYSPKGGTGCTTIAVNLAIALQMIGGIDTRVCLIDTNLQFGDVAVFMKLQVTRTLSDLATRTGDLDPSLLKTVAIPHVSGVKVLAAPVTPEEAEIFRESGAEEYGANRSVKAIVEYAQSQFDYIVIDTAREVNDILLAALDLSDIVLVVTRPVIPEIRGAKSFLGLLQKMNYSSEAVGLVINGVDAKRMLIQPEAIERALKPALVHIPLEEKSALRAANYGEPIVMKGSRTPIGQSFMQLAALLRERLTRVEEPEIAPIQESPKRAGLSHLL